MLICGSIVQRNKALRIAVKFKSLHGICYEQFTRNRRETEFVNDKKGRIND